MRVFKSSPLTRRVYTGHYTARIHVYRKRATLSLATTQSSHRTRPSTAPRMELDETLACLSEQDKNLLKRGDCLHATFASYFLPSLGSGKISKVGDLLLNSPHEVAQKCRADPSAVERMINSIHSIIIPRPIQRLKDVQAEGEGFTTGDSRLDEALGGGIRTGMIWEVAGERYVPHCSMSKFMLRRALKRRG
jgi:hypothetical protein